MSDSKPKKTIAIVINTSWNIYNFRIGLLKALRQEGYKILAIAPKDNYSDKLIELGFDYHEIKINNKGTNPLQDLLLMFSFYRLYKKLKPDVLLHYTIKPNIYGTLAAKLAGIPSLNNVSGLGTVFLNDNFSSKLAQKLYRFSMRYAQKVFFQNPDDRQLFIDKRLLAESQTALLPGSGINLEEFYPSPASKNKEDPFVFLLIARMIKDKGVLEFVKAAGQIRNTTHAPVEFCLLGEIYPANPTAISRDEIKDWQDQGLIKYLGHVDDVAVKINQSDCVVLPSYREGLSRVLLEAAALAKPIITSDTPGCRDVVDDAVNGYLCRVKDSKDLANQMQKMLDLSHEQRRAMGQKGRLKVEHEFDEKIVIKKYSQAILNAIPKAP